MDILVGLLLCVICLRLLNFRDQRARVALLGHFLGKYQIEKLMENLTQGYLRALGESDPQRQAAIWGLLTTDEAELVAQFNAFVLDFSKVSAEQARMSRLPVALPYATQWLANYSVDARKLLSLHAHALTQAAGNSNQLSPKAKAFTLMAEMFLMQHTCHWFCRSKLVASARLLARHQSPYAQVLVSIAPDTRRAYQALLAPH